MPVRTSLPDKKLNKALERVNKAQLRVIDHGQQQLHPGSGTGDGGSVSGAGARVKRA